MARLSKNRRRLPHPCAHPLKPDRRARHFSLVWIGRSSRRFSAMNRRRPRGLSSRPLVLIVDDHDDTCDLYVTGLAAFGFEAIAASDCAQAYRRARDSHPDIVVTDLTLGGANGWQLVQDLKRETRTRNIPVVVLTRHAAPSLRARAEREGCAAFVLKPCLPDELATELRQVLDRATARRAS